MVQNGGPSQMDLFDPKPELTKRAGQPHPDGVEIHQPNNQNILLPSSFQFSKHGQCGMELSEILPHLSTIADDICLVRSMHTEHNNHPEALAHAADVQDLPGPAGDGLVDHVCARHVRIRICRRTSCCAIPRATASARKLLWSSGWLPALYQGVEFSSSGTPVHHLKPSATATADCRNAVIWICSNELNQSHSQSHPGENELDARIQNFELAARMQLAAMDALDLSKEPESMRKLYGLDNPITAAIRHALPDGSAAC